MNKKSGFKICNPDSDSTIAFLKSIDETTEIGDDEVPTKFYEPVLDKLILKKETKLMIWDAISQALSENRLQPYIILLPKKYVTRKKIPREEIPIPFAEHVVYIVPYIREILVYEAWNEKDDE